MPEKLGEASGFAKSQTTNFGRWAKCELVTRMAFLRTSQNRRKCHRRTYSDSAPPHLTMAHYAQCRTIAWLLSSCRERRHLKLYNGSAKPMYVLLSYTTRWSVDVSGGKTYTGLAIAGLSELLLSGRICQALKLNRRFHAIWTRHP